MQTNLTLRAAEVAIHLSDGGGKLLRVQIFPISDVPLKHPAYGELLFDRAFAERLVANYRAYPGEVVGDYDHGTDAPANPEQGVTAGVVRAVKIEDGAVYAYLEPTERALRYVESGEYRLASPTVNTDWVNPTTGKAQGPTLLAVALTNRPFIRGMQPITAVDAANVALRAPKETEMSNPNPGAETISLADHNAQVQALRENVASLTERLSTTTASLNAVTAERDALRKSADEAVALSDVQKLEAEGKSTPAQRDSLVKLRISSPEIFRELAEKMPKVVPLSAQGANAPADPPVEDPQKRGLALSQRAEQLVTEGKAKDFRAALRAAKAEMGLAGDGLD